jgi:hypothetical protein
MMTKLLLAAVVIAACSRPTHTVRFANAPAVTAVDDRHHTPDAPAAREFAPLAYHLRGNLVRRVDRALSLEPPQRSLGVNALDEVPDSTWFTNRIGTRELTPDEVRLGPSGVGSPEPHLPWTIKSTKVGGISIGFIVEDARRETFVLKFDMVGYPELETGADAVAARLLWAIGYNVPEDHVVYFRPSDLVLPADAKIKDRFGNARPLRRAELDALLAGVEVERDGRLRGLASKFLPGKMLGGYPDEGVRADDPNDRIPHERRRDTRGAKPIFAWLDHIDMKEDNTVDVWSADAKDPARSYVRHYLIDFGKSFGVMAKSAGDPRRSHQYAIDVSTTLSSLASLGLTQRTWEGREEPALRGVGMYGTRDYDPAAWKPNTPSYLPLHLTDAVDGFWGAKLVMRFTRAQLAAAVDAGRYSDPRAAAYMIDTLVARQRITARYWFSQVAPLDGFRIEHGALCFDDLLLAYQLAAVERITRYAITTTDRHGRAIATTTLAPGKRGQVCASLALASDGDNYTIVHIRTTRHTFDRSTYVHLARRGGATHVIGIWRP